MAITATALTAGTIVYVGILAVGTTVPAFARGASSAAVSNVGLTTGTDPLRVASGATAQTTLPASVAYTTFGSNNSAPWIGLS